MSHAAEEWYWQRLSAVVLLLAFPVLLFLVMQVYHGALNQQVLLALIRQPVFQIGHTVLAVAVLIHAYIGCKIIIEDYVHRACVRTIVLAAFQCLVGGLAIAWLAAIWL